MTHHENIKIIAFVGLPGAGKSSAVDYVTEKGYPKVYLGGILYQAMTDAGIEITFESQQTFRENIRKEEGNDFVVQRAIKQIDKLIESGQHRIVVDGIYSWTEYKIMKHKYPGELTIIAVVAPKHMRHHRLSIRPERPLTNQEADQRDWAEIEGLEKGGPIAIADHFIINNGSLEQLHEKTQTELDQIGFFE